MHVIVTGGTGFIGEALVRRLAGRGDTVTVLTRNPAAARARLGAGCRVEGFGPASPEPPVLASAGAIVNLAGERIFGRRWNAAVKDRIRRSRLEATAALVRAIAALDPARRPRVLVSTSAIGYYGPRGDEELAEDAPPGSDFLAALCRDWEDAARRAEAHGVRVALARVGIVLGRGGGALPPMVLPFRLFAGGPIGDGRQWFSWIHREDLVSLLILALDDERVRGPLNATAPEPRTMSDFCRALGRTLRRPCWLPVPGFALRLAFGEAADFLLTGQRVIPRRALALGFAFRAPTAEEALRDLLRP